MVCLSGGVDSSLAAALLLEAGHEVVGVFMRSGVSGHATGERQGCCSVEDALDARRVADRLGIPFYPLNLADAFERLVARFAEDYARGRTPNPCVLCNRWFKLGHVLRFAKQVGAARVATGHYAQVVQDGARWTLARGRDHAKDQSYVLAVLEQEQLARTVLPLGGWTKAEVRREAAARGLVRVADKPESQEICFVPDDYRALLRARLPADAPALLPGEVQDEAGRVLGVHAGTAGFTVGQRRGLGIAAARPLYVTRTDPARRLVVVGERDALGCRAFEADEATYLARTLAPGEALRARVQVRAHGASAPAEVYGLTSGTFRVELDAPLEAVAAGQAAVVYDEADERVLLSGWIARTER